MNHNTQKYVHLNAKSLQSCPTLCNPMDCSPARLLSPWDSPGKDTGVGGHVLLQGIFLTQESNLYLLWLLHCRQILNAWVTGEYAYPYIIKPQFCHKYIICTMERSYS